MPRFAKICLNFAQICPTLIKTAYVCPDLPKFKHPQKAIYILGPEKGNLSNNILSRCKYTVRIPTKFCINIAMAGAIVMYDRVISLGQYKPRPVIFNQNNWLYINN